MDSGRVGDDAHATPCRWSSSTRAAPRKRRSHHEKAGPTRRHPSALASRLSRTVSPGGGTPPGGGDERRSTPEMISRLTLPATERPATARTLVFARNQCRPSPSPGLNSLGRLVAKRPPRPKAGGGPTPGRRIQHQSQTRSLPTSVAAAHDAGCERIMRHD
jgi:hypothetical protein